MPRRDRSQLQTDWLRDEPGAAGAPGAKDAKQDVRLADQLRRTATTRLGSEPAVGEGRVVYLDRMAASRAYCMLSEERFVLVREERKRPRVEGLFSGVAAIRTTAATLTVTLMADPLGPDADSRDQQDHCIYYGDHTWVRDLFTELAAARSPLFNERQQHLAQFRSRRLEPLVSWEHCPMCERPFDLRVDHVAFCVECRRLFADAGYEPVISLTVDPFSSILGAQPVAPPQQTADEEASWVRPYCMMRQANDVFDGNVIVDRELEWEASVGLGSNDPEEQRS